MDYNNVDVGFVNVYLIIEYVPVCQRLVKMILIIVKTNYTNRTFKYDKTVLRSINYLT